MKNPWRSVLFVDLDNTILHGPFESAVFPTVFREIAEKSGLDVAGIRGRVLEENRRRQETPAIPAVQAMDWGDIMATVAEGLGVQLTADVQQIVDAHAGPPHAAALDDAATVLRQLARPDRALVVATNGLRKYQQPVLDALGLTRLFTEILTPDTHNALKQDAAFYGDWPRVTQIQVSVGDRYDDDVLAPKSFGFRSIWKPGAPLGELSALEPWARPERFAYQEGQTIRPDAIIASLAELPAVIEQLEPFATSRSTRGSAGR